MTVFTKTRVRTGRYTRRANPFEGCRLQAVLFTAREALNDEPPVARAREPRASELARGGRAAVAETANVLKLF